METSHTSLGQSQHSIHAKHKQNYSFSDSFEIKTGKTNNLEERKKLTPKKAKSLTKHLGQNSGEWKCSKRPFSAKANTTQAIWSTWTHNDQLISDKK